MISFQDLCEFLTCNQRYSWFYFSYRMFKKFDDFENSIVIVEVLDDTQRTDIVRVWYPKSKHNSRPLTKEQFRDELQKAIDEMDWKRVKQLQERMKNE